MAKAVLVVAGLKPGMSWSEVRSNDDEYRLQSRQVLKRMNDDFGEDIADASYDDIRRKDLIYPVEAGVILKSARNANASTNDGTRAYAVNPSFAVQLRKYGTPDWATSLPEFLSGKEMLVESLNRRRELARIPVTIGTDRVIFSPGEHNQLQKAIITDFLTLFGHGAEVLYVGDTAEKFLFRNVKALRDLLFFEIAHDKLPDVLAFSREKNWLYLIEAVHSANPIDAMRKRTLELLTSDCKAEVIFVTAFLSRASFRNFAKEIAWETEVWIAEDPHHLIHFNGDKFLGPHRPRADQT